VLAGDENNILQVYKTINNSGPISSYDLTNFLDVDIEYPEADIEGATLVNNRIYWITSHGRNRNGEIRPNRYRFFATSVKVEDQNVTIEPVGVPYQDLVNSIIQTKSMRKLNLDQSTQLDEDLEYSQRKILSPKKEGLNIEALCASHDSKTMYIGFRNPRPQSELTSTPNALIIPLNNYQQVIETGESPVFGEPMLWDLAGLGIRSMEYSNSHKAYFIIAGAHDGEPTFALYCWSGMEDTSPVLVKKVQDDEDKFRPEALIPFDDHNKLLLLSDDGSLPVKVSDPSECMDGEMSEDGYCLNKYLTDPHKKSFRAITLDEGFFYNKDIPGLNFPSAGK